MKKLFIVAIPVVLVLVSYFALKHEKKETAAASMETMALQRGNIENLVSSTGTVEAIGTVQVGTQVSGTVDQVFVDFNSHVKKDQLIAVLDKRLLKSAVQESQANLMKVQAQLDLAESEFKRVKKLFSDKMISDQDYISAKTSVETSKAAVILAQTGLEKTETNLKYAEIRSPINGTVIQRNIEPGQTVAASFSTPTLFLIAEDLTQMEIHAFVDESDIGQIKNGQKVRFSVEAYPDESFTGVVRQIRLEPTTVSNVVNYTVIISAQNPKNLLLPGMTATVDFIAQKLDNVLLVPNSALRFKPSEEMLAAFRNSMKKRFNGMSPEQQQKARQRMEQGNNQNSLHQNSDTSSSKTVWILDDKRNPRPARFIPGTTDGKFTAVKKSRTLDVGTRVIIGMDGGSGEASGNNHPPFRRRLF